MVGVVLREPGALCAGGNKFGADITLSGAIVGGGVDCDQPVGGL
jgi:hypothetical protein